jgi:endonuclease/exonuclease/phosphatase family metal-dependent hydrolase
VAELHVMTFNLRFASTREPNSWARRRPVMRELLVRERPHLIGTQEGLYRQLRDIARDLGRPYKMIGMGREGGRRGEFVAIWYDRRRLKPERYEHFWLSDTPEVIGSNTWGGGSIRMVTWARFLDRETGRQFYAANTHLDNVSAEARVKAAHLIRERLSALRPRLPVVLTGDFNAAARAGEPVYDGFVQFGDYGDAWTAAERRGPAYGTCHGYLPLASDGVRIDWILVSQGVAVTAASINTYQRDGQFPSDHLPVQAWLRLDGLA